MNIQCTFKWFKCSPHIVKKKKSTIAPSMDEGPKGGHRLDRKLHIWVERNVVREGAGQRQGGLHVAVSSQPWW